MVGNLLRVTHDELEAYLKDSSLLESKLERDADDQNPSLLYIDKAWDGLLFLLTGQGIANLDMDHPLTGIFFSGQLVDEAQDLGYGPAHYLRPDKVKEINASISAISIGELEQKFDPARMVALGVYPTIWDKSAEALSYLTESFKDVQTFYSTAARHDEAVITFIN